MARNLTKAPPLPPNSGVEVWLSNSPGTFARRMPDALPTWTRWFNLHSRQHILGKYPSAWEYWQHEAKGRPVYLQKKQPDIRTSIAFPRERIQQAFATAKGPNRFFTCSVCWLIAFAILEGFERIELWGFALRDDKRKPGACYAYERPCFFYWVKQARDRGIEVTYQKEVESLPFLPGDPDEYTGLLYGYSTKPEKDWDITTETWKS